MLRRMQKTERIVAVTATATKSGTARQKSYHHPSDAVLGLDPARILEIPLDATETHEFMNFDVTCKFKTCYPIRRSATNRNGGASSARTGAPLSTLNGSFVRSKYFDCTNTVNIDSLTSTAILSEVGNRTSGT